MTRYSIVRLPPETKTPADVPGERLTITTATDLPRLDSLQDLFTWLQNNPDFIAMLIAALMAAFTSTRPDPQLKSPPG